MLMMAFSIFQLLPSDQLSNIIILVCIKTGRLVDIMSVQRIKVSNSTNLLQADSIKRHTLPSTGWQVEDSHKTVEM